MGSRLHIHVNVMRRSELNNLNFFTLYWKGHGLAKHISHRHVIIMIISLANRTGSEQAFSARKMYMCITAFLAMKYRDFLIGHFL